MNESLHRQRCYAYLLDQMGTSDRERFEDSLDKDGTLAVELKRCESELVEFADSSLPDLRPPEALWGQIVDQVRASGDEEEAAVAVSGEFNRAGRLIKFGWPIAALFLLGLNLWQFGSRPLLDSNGGQGPDSMDLASGVADSATEDQVSETARSALETDIEEGGEGTVSAESYAALVESRDSLVKRVEYLENNYLELAEVTSPLFNEFIGGSKVAGIELVQTVQSPDGTSEVFSIWERVEKLLPGPGLVLLSKDRVGAGDSDGKVDLVFSNTSPELIKAFLDENVISSDQIGTVTIYGDGNSRESDKTLLALGVDTIVIGPDGDVLEPGDDSLASTDASEPETTLVASVISPLDGETEDPDSFDGDLPFALVSLNPDNEVGILDVGNMPDPGEGNELVVWARDGDSGEYSRVGALSSEVHGSGGNFGFRLDGVVLENVDSFLVTNQNIATEEAVGDTGQRNGDVSDFDTPESVSSAFATGPEEEDEESTEQPSGEVVLETIIKP